MKGSTQGVLNIDHPPFPSPFPASLGVLTCLWCRVTPHRQQKGAIVLGHEGRCIWMIGLIFA